jgi:hypothetical protein
MILDRIEKARLYEPLHKGFWKAFAVLADPALAHKPDGRHDADGLTTCFGETLNLQRQFRPPTSTLRGVCAHLDNGLSIGENHHI